jgi:hypothetical protein
MKFIKNEFLHKSYIVLNEISINTLNLIDNQYIGVNYE